MKLLILGPGESGKTTVAKYIAETYGIQYRDSSEAAAEVIKPVLDLWRGRGCCAARHHELRRHHRTLWAECIALYNAHDATALARKVLESGDIYVGMRKLREYNACMRAGLFNTVFYCDCGGRPTPQDTTLEIPQSEGMYAIDTSSTDTRMMEVQVDRIMGQLGIQPKPRDTAQWHPQAPRWYRLKSPALDS